LAYLLYRFARVGSIEAWPLGGRLLVLQLFEQVDHELVAVVLLDGLKPPSQKLLEARADNMLPSR